MRLPRFWMRQLNIRNRVHLAIVYNTTLTMTDGPIHVYRNGDSDIGVRTYQLRIGHLWFDVDLWR